MFSGKPARALFTILILPFLILPCAAGESGGNGDDGASVRDRPSRSPTRVRADESASWNDSGRVYRMKNLSSFGDDSETSRAARGAQRRLYGPKVNRMRPASNLRERFPQPKDSTPYRIIMPKDKEESRDTRQSWSGDEDAASQDDASEEARGENIERPREIESDQTVYATRRLQEYHIKLDCPMLENIDPTPLTFRRAKASEFTKCSVCGKGWR